MFPIRDHNSSHKRPYITIAIIAINVLVFFYQLIVPNLENFIQTYALVPASIDFLNISTLVPFITSMFLHGGWFHLLSNMWFLWIFGDNVEATFGRIGFILMYLLSGLSGSFLQYIFSTGSAIPMLGASGAIAGVLGAYLVFFPRASIETLVIYFGFYRRINVSAKIMLFYWFATQLFSGVGTVVVGALASGGVAWFAHIGGFVSGFVLSKQFKKRLTWYRIH